jgi:predicted Zn finger-like uncharacterized protein
MQVTCPHCSTRYVLLESMLGPLGARVRCPRCREPFTVSRDGIVSAETPAAGGNGTAETSEEPVLAASAALDEPSHSMDAAAGSAAGFAESQAAETTDAPAPVESRVAPAREAESPRTSWFSRPSRESRAAVAPAPPPAPPPATESPDEIARSVLGELAAHSGEAIAAAQAQGRLFAEFGAVIGEAFEFYQRRIGSSADPAPFRIALREQWGVDLEPPAMRLPRV